jgi:methionyl-tRNA synthetase
VLGFLKNNTLEDLCITRPTSRLNWGIPLPFDPEFVTYVWFDALSNYASLPGALGDPGVTKALGLEGQANGPELWPADYHVIGKDIVKFHCVYWPIMLKAMGLPLPHSVLVLGWWQKDNQKMSKSIGNVVDPVAVINEWGVDAFRYYVIRELAIGPDGNWTDTGFEARYNAELADGLGNLLNRSLSMLKRYRQGVVPSQHNELAGDAKKTLEAVKLCYFDKIPRANLRDALQEIWVLVNRANKFIEETAPFKMAKDPAKAQRLDEVLYNLMESCRVLAVLLWPFLPGTAEKMYQQLGLTGVPNNFKMAEWGGLQAGHKIGEIAPLFPKKEKK